MRIGVSINGVLRNYFKQIETVHTKYFPSEDEDDEIKVLDYDLHNWVKFPKETTEQVELTFNPDFNPFDSKDRDSVVDLDLETVEEETTVEEFLYEKCTLEIFGSAEEMVPNAVKVLNSLILEYPEHEFIIISRELGLSIPSTYFFLSKTSCMCQSIQFVTDSRDSWHYVDMMVTDHPDVINSRPSDKTCVVIDKDFNQSIEINPRIDSIKGLGEYIEKLKQPTQK
jgi:hypothetical protein